jgi:tetratricopeptide (TPR) repeat protein
LLGDLYNDEAAISHALTAALCANEAGVSVAAALSAQAKTERWRGRYQVSADAARQGFECSPPTPLRILLACQEANAAGLLGDSGRAREALRRAEQAADTVIPDSGVTPWSCPPPRQALFELSVSLQLGDADAALRAAEKADAAWNSGEPYVHGTWAQIRFGAGNAYVMMGDLDGAAQQILPVMNMQPEHRMATITNYLVAMDARLEAEHFRGSDLAADIRGQIREFNSAAAPYAQEKP